MQRSRESRESCLFKSHGNWLIKIEKGWIIDLAWIYIYIYTTLSTTDFDAFVLLFSLKFFHYHLCLLILFHLCHRGPEFQPTVHTKVIRSSCLMISLQKSFVAGTYISLKTFLFQFICVCVYVCKYIYI